MLIQRPSDVPSSEITTETLYHNRREFIKAASAVLGIAAAGTIIPGCEPSVGAAGEPQAKGRYDTTEKPNTLEDITSYNNYYEFGTNKDDPKLEEFAEVARQVAAAKKVPLNDLRKAFVAFWKKKNADNKPSGILTYDGNHFNQNGMDFVAEQMLSKFK